MATMDDRLLGEKRTNYVSSSESEGETSEPSSNISPPSLDGLPQTGPKGVLTDYYRAQKEERQQAMLAEKNRRKLIEKHTATVMSYAEENAKPESPPRSPDSAAIVNLARALEEGSLSKDPFMQEYRAKRLEEMKQQAKLGAKRQRFGHLVEVRGDKYDTIIDAVSPNSIVIMHIYDELLAVCQQMNKCLTKLAKLYPTAKFCRVQSHQVGVSHDFVKNGLPALLVYRGSQLVGNLLRVTDTLGQEYTIEDLESFLQEKNCLPPEDEKEEELNFVGGSSAKKLLGSIEKTNNSSGDSD